MTEVQRLKDENARLKDEMLELQKKLLEKPTSVKHVNVKEISSRPVILEMDVLRFWFFTAPGTASMACCKVWCRKYYLTAAL